MMKFWKRFGLTLMVMGMGAAAQGQALNYTPPAFAAYISPNPGVWNAWSSAAAFGSLSYTPSAIGLYCQASNGAPWTPCVPGGGGAGVSSINSNTGAFTFTGSGVNCVTTTCTFSGGGGIANVVVSSGYATIELAVAACGGTYPCQILVNSTLTQSTTGTYTLPTGVSLQFFAGGALSFSGKTLSFANTSGVILAPIANIGLGTGTVTGLNGLVPAEWFGAVGDGALGSGGTGTDNHVAIQSAINSLRSGQVLLQSKIYSIGTSTLSVTTSGVGIAGQTVGYAYPASTQPSSIIMSNSPTADILDVTGTSSSAPLVWNRFDHFALHRVVTSTATTYGFNASFTGGLVADNITSQDSYVDFRFHSCPSFGGAGATNASAGWGYSVVTSSTYVGKTLYGFMLDSLDGNAENSLTMTNDGASVASTNNAVNSYGFYITGTAINDIDIINGGTAGTKYGVGIVTTGSPATGYAFGDIQFVNLTVDNFTTSGVYISGVTLPGLASVTFVGGYVSGGGIGCSYDIQSSAGILISNQMIQSGTNGVCATSSQNIKVASNTFHEIIGTDLLFTGTTDSAVTGNTFSAGSPTTSSTMLSFVSSGNNAVTGNTLAGSTNGAASIGINFDSASVTNCVSGNNIDVSGYLLTAVAGSQQVQSSGCNTVSTQQYSNNGQYIFVPPTAVGGSNTNSYFGSVVNGQLLVGWNCLYNGSNWIYGPTTTTSTGCGTLRLTNTASGGGFEMNLVPQGAAGASISAMDSTYAAFVGQWTANNLPQFGFNMGTTVPTYGTSTILSVNPTRTTDNAATVQITTTAIGNKSLVVQGTSGQTANLLEVQSSTGTVLASISAAGVNSSPQFIPTGSAPTVANGAGAGTSPGTPTITGANQSGILTIITGTATTANATVATITFNGTLSTAPQGCHLEPRNAAAATNSTTTLTGSPSTTTWTLQSGAAALTVSTTFIWSYFCI